jgi:hypothetical protein
LYHATNLLLYLFLFPHQISFSEFVLGFPCLALVSQFGWFGRHEERKKIVYDIGGGDARDISVIVCWCDFNDVRATRRKRDKGMAYAHHFTCELLKKQEKKRQDENNAHEIEACETADDALHLTCRPPTWLGGSSCEGWGWAEETSSLGRTARVHVLNSALTCWCQAWVCEWVVLRFAGDRDEAAAGDTYQ